MQERIVHLEKYEKKFKPRKINFEKIVPFENGKSIGKVVKEFIN